MHRFVPERQLVVDGLDHFAERVFINCAMEVRTKFVLKLDSALPATTQVNKTSLFIMGQSDMIAVNGAAKKYLKAT